MAIDDAGTVLTFRMPDVIMGARSLPMPITLPPELESFVNGKVAKGDYPSADAAIVDSVRRWHDDEVIDCQLSEGVKQSVREGFAQIDRGECEEFDRAGMRKFFQQLRDEAAEQVGTQL